MTTLSGPKRCAFLEDAPQQWTPLSTSTLWEGAVVGTYPIGSPNAGFLDNIEASLSMQVKGVCRRNVAAGMTESPEVDEKIIPMVFTAIDTTMRGAVVYGLDSATGSLSPGAGAPIGMLMEVVTATKGWVGVGPSFLARALASFGAAAPAPTYRAVITTIAAYVGTGTGTLTASATGAIGAQDTGVTLLAGDRVFLPVITGGAGGATVAADSGPYIVVNPGGTGVKFVLTRPPEYPHAGVIPESYTIKIGTEGTIWPGNDWRSFPVDAIRVIGTDDPHFWPRTYSADLTVAGANTTFWLRNTKAVAGVNKTSINGWWASTLTAGAGNGAVTITGTAADHVEFTAINF